MRTTLDIPSETLAELKKAIPARSQAEAVRRALAEFIRQHKRDKLRQLWGRLHIQDVGREMEKAELADARQEREELAADS
jgi:hypothetical protein